MERITERVEREPSGDFRLEVDDRTVKLSNLDRELFPEAGFTKGDLIDYYAAVSGALIPHLAGRPLTLRRFPGGVESPGFWEKRCPEHRPGWVRTAEVWSRTHGEMRDYCLADDLPSLVWAANLADIELHTSLATGAERERPTALVFDLDPGAPAGIQECCEIALLLRDGLRDQGLHALPKTSGSKGLQVYAPLNDGGGTTYAQTKPFARAVAGTFAEEMPKKVVSKMKKSLRKGKVLIDWSQNDVHKTTVCVYSVRARPIPTVSTPVSWGEVERAYDRGRPESLTFTAEEVVERVEAEGDLFAPVLSETQTLPD